MALFAATDRAGMGGGGNKVTHTRRDFLFAAAASTAAVNAQVVGQPGAGNATAGTAPRVMAIAAHPGDAFFSMGAPVALAAQQEGAGCFLSLSLGGRGSASIPAQRYGEMQRQASLEAAQQLHGEALFLTYEDGEIPDNDEIRFAVCDRIREFRPTSVVTHWKGSWHKDHRACHGIVEDAVFYAALPAIARAHPAHSVDKVFYAWNWEDADGFRADTYLDISPVFDAWKAACALFPMWRGETGFRYDDYYQSCAVQTGCLCGFHQAVALMSPPEQTVRRLRSLASPAPAK
jgi:N-acetylglucosamine malate deacetylase 1